MAAGGAEQRAWWAQVWTRRQSPEWRPRRASVAACCGCSCAPAGSPLSQSARRLLGAFDAGERPRARRPAQQPQAPRRRRHGRRHMSCTLPALAHQLELGHGRRRPDQEADEGGELGQIELERKSIIYSMALRQLAGGGCGENRHRRQRPAATGLGGGACAPTCCHDDLERAGSNGEQRASGRKSGGGASGLPGADVVVSPASGQPPAQQKVAAASDVGEHRPLDSSPSGGASDSASDDSSSNHQDDDDDVGASDSGNGTGSRRGTKQEDQLEAAPMATAAEDEARDEGAAPPLEEEERPWRRRCGELGAGCGQAGGLDNLEALIVESWLDDHPRFVHDYFVRKASRGLIDDWLVANAKVNSGNQLDGGGPHLGGSPQVIVEHRRLEPAAGGRRAQPQHQQGSGHATPVRKISATDFESRTGAGFLRPMVSTTPDGRQTFLAAEAPQSRGEGAEQPGAEAPADDRDEVRLVFELVKSIYQEMDVRSLLYKILKNIALLINADKSSLFLVCGEPGDPQRRLVSQLFDVEPSEASPAPEPATITIPWGQGLVGWVAQSGEAVNIANCYADPRFTDAVDQRTGYLTRHMLCAPIFDKRQRIVGVAQVINRRDGQPFSWVDEQKFKRYLQFCGIGLSNAQSYENCQLENRRNQLLLDLARMVFEEQSTIEQVVYRIMLHTASLLDCQRCQVLLVDHHGHDDDLDQLLHLAGPRRGPQQHCVAPEAAKPEWRPQCNGPGAQHQHQHQCYQSPEPAAKLGVDQRSQEAALEQPKLFSLVFDLECDQAHDLVMRSSSSSGGNNNNSDEHKRFPINIGITGYVATTGRTLNIEDAHRCERFDPKVDEGSSFRHRSILCMPIRNGRGQIIGVSQLVNKKNGRPFNKNDEDLFEAFAIFCGLGIHNTLMYEKVLKIMAKQRVTFEVLSYHATAPLEEAKKLNQEPIPSSLALNLMSLKYDDFSLNEQFMLKSCLRFFLDLDLMRRFQIDKLVFCNWILSVQKNYRKVTYHPIVGGNGLKASPVRYHNWRHAFNVTQMMFAILINTQICQSLGELETLALLIACLCHDLDHRGTNNSFQIKSASPLAQLYSTSTMEHHHFDQCVMILNSQGNQILANLSPDEYSRVIVLLEEAILATDLANYFQKREHFFQLVNSGQFEWRRNHQHRSLLRCMLMTGCDVAAITKPWRVQKVVAGLVMSEFYQQGDIERQELNIEPIDMMNRDKMSKLPDMQIGFIDSICAPIYAAFARLFPHELGPLLEGCLLNRNVWAEIAKKNNHNNNNNNNQQAAAKPPAKTCAHDDKQQAPLISYLNNRNNSAPIITILPTNQTTDLSTIGNNLNDLDDSRGLDSRHSSSLTLLEIYDNQIPTNQHCTSPVYHLTTTHHSPHISDEQRRSV